MNESSHKRIKNKDENLVDDFLKENKIIFKKYKPIKLIGKGAFSNIYSTIKLEDKSVFAMKVQKKDSKNKMLEIEAYHLYFLQGFGIPKLITFGCNKNYDILIESLLGKTLFEIFIKYKKPCDLINTCLIAIQLIERLEFIHSKNFIYRDVKPENFIIGIKDPDVVYIIDFGLCKKYRSSKTGKHLQQRNTKKICGTLKYSSANVLKGKELSRRDDLISLGYVIIFLYKRHLPWNLNLNGLNNKTYFELVLAKETNNNGEIFKNIPEEMAEFLKYAQNLKFEEDPDYNYMKGLFKILLSKKNYDIQKLNFCWINPNDKGNRSLSKTNNKYKINPRLRILQNLENKRLKNMQIVSKEELGKDKMNNEDENDKINKNNLTLNNFTDYNTKPNKTMKTLSKGIKDEIKTEYRKNKKVKRYIKKNEEKNKMQNYRNKNIIYTTIKEKPISSIYKSSLNRNKIQYNTINTNKNAIINNSNNIYLNFRNFNKGGKDNTNIFDKMNYSKKTIDFNLSNTNEDIYTNHTTNYDNDKNYLDMNANNNMNNKILNINTSNNKIRYKPIFAVKKMKDYLYNSNNNKIYKSKIKIDNVDIKNTNIKNNIGKFLTIQNSRIKLQIANKNGNSTFSNQ